MPRPRTLETCPIVLAVEELDLTPAARDIADPALRDRYLARLARVSVRRIRYKANSLAITGFVAMPRTGQALPCIVSLRGGSGDFGAYSAVRIMGDLALYADQGYVVIATQYPGVDGGEGKDAFGGPDDLESINALKRILSWIPQADTSRIGVKGNSRGGLMAYMLLREANWVRAAVIGAATTDQFMQAKERAGWRAHQASMFKRTRAELLRRSPARWAGELPRKAPILIMHGTADARVSPMHSLRMSSQLLKYLVPHRLVLFEGVDHATGEFQEEYVQNALRWFKQYLAPDRKLPNVKPHGK